MRGQIVRLAAACVSNTVCNTSFKVTLIHVGLMESSKTTAGTNLCYSMLMATSATCQASRAPTMHLAADNWQVLAVLALALEQCHQRENERKKQGPPSLPHSSVAQGSDGAQQQRR